MEVTKVSFSYANSKKKRGSCGFASIHINDEVVINRVVVSRTEQGNYVVRLPNNKVKNKTLPVVAVKSKENIRKLNDAVLSEFYRLTEENNGLYKKS